MADRAAAGAGIADTLSDGTADAGGSRGRAGPTRRDTGGGGAGDRRTGGGRRRSPGRPRLRACTDQRRSSRATDRLSSTALTSEPANTPMLAPSAAITGSRTIIVAICTAAPTMRDTIAAVER
ncbi:hypothetical protein LTR94_032482, partial [Friedmanniomyces endolithicus]